MKVPCEIIRDVLPLYAEDMASPATKDMVEEHLGECPDCTQELEALKAPPVPVVLDVEDKDLTVMRHIRKSILMRRLLAVLAAVLLVVSVVSAGFCYLQGIVPYAVEDLNIEVEATERGGLMVRFDNFSSRSHDFIWQEEDNHAIMQFASRMELLRSKETVRTAMYLAGGYGENGHPQSEINLWYVNPKTGEPDTLLWDAGKPTPAELEPEQKLSIHFSKFPQIFCGVFTVLSGLLMGVSLLSKNQKIRNATTVASIFTLGQLVSTAVNTDAGFQVYSGMVLAEMIHFLMMGLLFSATALCWRKVFQLGKQDRGM